MNADEKRGYGKGYAAGLKRQERDQSTARSRRKAHYWNRAFLAALPACLTAQGWERGGEAIKKLDDRVQLASETADEALKHYKEFA